MPKKKTTKKTRSRAKAKSTSLPRIRVTRRGVALTAQILLFAGFIVGGILGVNRAQARADELAMASPRTVDVLWPDASGMSANGGSTWLPARAQDQITKYAQTLANDHPGLHAVDLGQIQTRIRATGWFVGQDPSVQLVGTDTIRIQGRWKLPAAVVRFNSNDHLISWDREVMPLVYPAGESSEIVILNAQLQPASIDPVIRRQTQWPGDDVAWAVDLIGLLHPEPFIDQVVAIDVQRTRGASPEISIITADGGVIEWGRPPGVWTAGEVDEDIKLQRLRDLDAETGAIDAGAAVLNIAGAHIVRKALRPD